MIRLHSTAPMLRHLSANALSNGPSVGASLTTAGSERARPVRNTSTSTVITRLIPGERPTRAGYFASPPATSQEPPYGCDTRSVIVVPLVTTMSGA